MDKSKFAVTTYNKIADIYTRQYFADFTDTPYLDKFLSFLPKKAKVLDVGCGPGQFTKYMLENGLEVESIDLSPKMLAIARRKVLNGKFKLMDMRKLTFEDNSFDGIVAAYSLIHIPSNEVLQTVQGYRKVLKDNGYLLLITQKGEADKTVAEPLKEGEKTFINFFTKVKLHKYLKEAGFEIVFQKETKSSDPESMSNKVIYTIATNK